MSAARKGQAKVVTRRRRNTKHVFLTSMRGQIVVGVSLLLGVSLLMTAIYYVTRVEGWQIQTVSVTGGATVPSDLIAHAVEEELEGTYWRLVPKRFAFTYPQQRIIDRIYTEDRIKQVAVARGDSQSLQVIFEEYIPQALWCTSLEDTSCVFLDQTGYGFAAAPSLTGSALVRYIEAERTPSPRAAGFESAYMDQTEAFIQQLEHELNLFVVAVEMVGGLDIHYTLSHGGVLKVAKDAAIDETVRDLQFILASEDFLHLQQAPFVYIDLRFGDRVFVNEALATSTAAEIINSED